MQQNLSEFNIEFPELKTDSTNNCLKKEADEDEKAKNDEGQPDTKENTEKKEIKPSDKKIVYSHSRLNSFEQCKLKYKYKYIDKLKTEIEGTVEAFMGTRVHDALEKLYKDMKFEKINTLKELLDHYNSEWDKNWNENILMVRDYPPENFRNMGEKFITKYYERFKPFNQDKTIDTEKKITIKLGKYNIMGFIDRLSYEGDGVYVVSDYKTANTLITQDYADKDRQLALYAIAIKELYKDCKEVKLVWHYLAFDKTIVSYRTDEQLEELKEDIIELIKEIEKNNAFPAMESALCSWCEYRPFCPNFKHQYSLEKKDENEYMNDDGVKLVNKYSELAEEKDKVEKELEKVKEALVEYAKKEGYGSVKGTNNIAIIRSYPRMSFPKKDDPRKEEFFETIKKLGLWEKLSIVDVYELSKMINNKELHPDFVKILDKFIEKGSCDKLYLREIRG